MSYHLTTDIDNDKFVKLEYPQYLVPYDCLEKKINNLISCLFHKYG
jgi:hypothetical protein